MATKANKKKPQKAEWASIKTHNPSTHPSFMYDLILTETESYEIMSELVQITGAA